MKKIGVGFLIIAVCFTISSFGFAQKRSVMFENTQFGKWVITSSSTLNPQVGNSYAPKNIADGNNNTAWVEGAKGHGIGETIMITFESPMKIGTIRVKNGYGKNAAVYKKNSRIKSANIQANGGVYKVTLKDTPNEQVIKLPNYMKNVRTDWIKLTIDSVYPGTKYTDTALDAFMPDLEEYNYQ